MTYKIKPIIGINAITLINDKLLYDKINEFDKFGGCIEFKVFKLIDTESSYDSHLAVAKSTLIEISKTSNDYFEKVASELNTIREQYFNQTIDFEKLETSGVKLTFSEFLGPHFDIKTNRPIIRGKRNFYNSYFFFDTEEIEENAVDFYKISEKFTFKDTDGISLGFCGAFLEPPFTPRFGEDIYSHGKYFLDFCNLLFSDLSKLEVYKWSVDCTNYFDAGKEWWGSHFWTIFNPEKNIYIGATASTTDQKRRATWVLLANGASVLI